MVLKHSPDCPPFRQAACLALVAILASHSVSALAGAADCTAPRTSAGVAAVLDDLDLALDDGREIRLAGVDPVRGTPSRPGLGEDARQKIAAWLSGRTVSILAFAGPDRWDRTAALAWVTDDGPAPPATPKADSASIAGAVIAAGFGRVRPEPQLPSCFSEFRTEEREARAAGLGLWGDPYYAILDASDGDALAQRNGAMAIVEGRVRIGVGRARSYLRLGHGIGSFAATLSRKAAKVLAASGLDPAGLAGKHVRIRGVLDDRFGPQIDVISADQIEILDDSSVPAKDGR